MKSDPSKCLIAPIIVFTSVVFPEPFGPTIVTISPELTSIETLLRTVLAPYLTLILSVDTNFKTTHYLHKHYKFPQLQ